MSKEFNSKVILFGEYAVLRGGKLLALPYEYFSGTLKIEIGAKPIEKESNRNIRFLYNYIKDKEYNYKPNLNLFDKDLDKGLYFDSNIPQGFGVGSSGALVAAIYDRYFLNRNKAKFDHSSLLSIQNDLAQIESFFHGNSSGADPLVSYTNQFQLLNAPPAKTLTLNDDLFAFLIDTQTVGETENYVNQFMNNSNTELIKQFVEVSNNAIDAYLRQQEKTFDLILELAEIESQLLSDMLLIPKRVQVLKNKLKDDIAIKLCGSGGGGFLLAFVQTINAKSILEQFKEVNIPTFPLYNMD